MKRLHLWIGALALLAFFGTGLAMSIAAPPLSDRVGLERALFRSRHIYLLSTALLNLLLGVYFQDVQRATRGVQRAGSVLLLASPLVALAGFVHDPRTGSLAGAMLGKYAVYSIFGGVLLHVLSAIPWSRPR
jgi:hypothetical protein